MMNRLVDWVIKVGPPKLLVWFAMWLGGLILIALTLGIPILATWWLVS